jgi:hypothetical protein
LCVLYRSAAKAMRSNVWCREQEPNNKTEQEAKGEAEMKLTHTPHTTQHRTRAKTGRRR